MMTDTDLIEQAEHVSEMSKCKLSKFVVGAAIQDDSGRVFLGTNIEFDNYSNTIHAEESAISSWTLGGGSKMKTIAIFTYAKISAFPCGMCRQSLYELGGSGLRVVSATNSGDFQVRTMGKLLPDPFKL